MKPSPQGRFPNAPGSVRFPSSGIPLRPVRSNVASVPSGQLTRAVVPAVSSLAIAFERAAIFSKSTAIARASISGVTPGIVAPRMPASVACFLVVVWLSDLVVAAM